MMPNLPVLRPYSVSTPMIATITSSGTPKLSLARFRVAWCCPEAGAAGDATLVQEACAVAFPRTLQFGDRRRRMALSTVSLGCRRAKRRWRKSASKPCFSCISAMNATTLGILREGRFLAPASNGGPANRAVATRTADTKGLLKNALRIISGLASALQRRAKQGPAGRAGRSGQQHRPRRPHVRRRHVRGARGRRDLRNPAGLPRRPRDAGLGQPFAIVQPQALGRIMSRTLPQCPANDRQQDQAGSGEQGRHAAPVDVAEAEVPQLALAVRIVTEHPLVPAIVDGFPTKAQLAQPVEVERAITGSGSPAGKAVAIPSSTRDGAIAAVGSTRCQPRSAVQISAQAWASDCRTTT